jgi:hypothetical protein
MLLADHQDSADIRGEAVDFSTPRALIPGDNQSGMFFPDLTLCINYCLYLDVFEEDSFFVSKSKYAELQEQFDELHKRFVFIHNFTHNYTELYNF